MTKNCELPLALIYFIIKRNLIQLNYKMKQDKGYTQYSIYGINIYIKSNSFLNDE